MGEEEEEGRNENKFDEMTTKWKSVSLPGEKYARVSMLSMHLPNANILWMQFVMS